MKLTLNLVEYVSNQYVKGPVEIDTDNYPELEGMDEDEMRDYISENFYDMDSTKDNDNLYQDLRDQEVVFEKNLNDADELLFDYENE